MRQDNLRCKGVLVLLLLFLSFWFVLVLDVFCYCFARGSKRYVKEYSLQKHMLKQWPRLTHSSFVFGGVYCTSAKYRLYSTVDVFESVYLDGERVI